MRAAISSGGRDQFSFENAYSVRWLTPMSRQAVTTLRTAFIPSRCPMKRGSPRSPAQRPLPSMMIAM